MHDLNDPNEPKRPMLANRQRRPHAYAELAATSSGTRPKPKQTYVVTPESHTTLFSKKSFAQVDTLVSPPKSGGQEPGAKKRRNPLTVRLCDADREVIRTKAVEAGCASLNAYARASLLGSEYKPPKDPELVQSLLKLNLELTRQGVNLNQIARHLNARAISDGQGEAMLSVLARSTLQTHGAIRKVLAPGDTSGD